jgi:2-oxoglutarate ferredoxin oxidoreductase subunit delta
MFGYASPTNEDIMAKGKSVIHVIDTHWCKGCGICVHFCPKQVLELDTSGKARAVRPEDCIACKLCELRCPDLAIQIQETQEGENDSER